MTGGQLTTFVGEFHESHRASLSSGPSRQLQQTPQPGRVRPSQRQVLACALYVWGLFADQRSWLGCVVKFRRGAAAPSCVLHTSAVDLRFMKGGLTLGLAKLPKHMAMMFSGGPPFTLWVDMNVHQH